MKKKKSYINMIGRNKRNIRFKGEMTKACELKEIRTTKTNQEHEKEGPK